LDRLLTTTPRYESAIGLALLAFERHPDQCHRRWPAAIDVRRDVEQASVTGNIPPIQRSRTSAITTDWWSNMLANSMQQMPMAMGK